MLIYSAIMFLAAALLLALSIAVYRGKTDLIHDYHQAGLADKPAYGKAFGKALSVFAASALLSGLAGLLAPSHGLAAAVAILIAGFAVGTALIIAVQRKYNG